MQLNTRWFFLFRQLLERELAARYKTTALGTIWLVLQPLLMLSVYTLVFSGIFKVRWAGTQTTAGFALILFAGLVVFNFLSEVLVSAPSIIVSQPNYIKKVVFPVAMLPAVKVAAAFVTAMVSLAILVVANMWITGNLTMKVLLGPLILLEMVPMLLAIVWTISAIGVYLRDLMQIIGIVSSILLFISPIFFPPSAIPKGMELLIDLNPLVVPMQQLRAVTVQPLPLDFLALGKHFCGSLIVAVLSFLLFRRLSRGFSDVL
jgi:lipopolysaccharide transport system permease protein